jgi:8-oxo-dGTP diphosphatase
MSESADPMNPFIVGGLLVRRDGTLRILLGRRSETRRVYPNVWDVPGGHSEPGERAEETLIRELREEIAVLPTEWRLLGHIDLPAHAREAAMVLCLYEVTSWTGTPSNLEPEEHAEIRWLTIDEACQLRLAHPAYVQLFRGLAPAASGLP